MKEIQSMFKEKLQVLLRHEAVVIDRKTSIAATVQQMQEQRVNCVLVSEEGKLAGLVCERNICSQVLAGDVPMDAEIAKIMTTHLACLSPEDNVGKAIHALIENNYRYIPVATDDEIKGIVSVSDIVDYLVEYFPDEVINLPPGLHQNFSEAEGE